MERDILTSNGMDIHLVRYFDYQDRKYLIFTSDGEGETDGQGHVFVHISEINNLTAVAVEGESYETVKNIIKDVVTKNRNNLPLPITDLNYNELNGLNVISSKQLGLLENYVEILKQNQPDFPDQVQNNFETTFNQEQSENPFINLQSEDIKSEPLNENSEFAGPSTSFNSFDISGEEQLEKNNDADLDYEKMYLEQVELVNKLNSEIEIYKNKLETLKNIINN